MNDNYILVLYHQFCAATGKVCNEINLFKDSDFFKWLSELDYLLDKYISFLEYIGILDYKNIVELNKGKYDSLGCGASFVSPYASTMGYNNKILYVSNDLPIIQSGTNLYDASNVEFFITHNPYNINFLKPLDEIHNIGYNICFSIIGKKDDADHLQKIVMLNEFISKLNEQYKVYYETYNDYYFGCVRSLRKTKGVSEK